MSNFSLLVLGTKHRKQLRPYDYNLTVPIHKEACLCYKYTADNLPDYTCSCQGRGWYETVRNPKGRFYSYKNGGRLRGFFILTPAAREQAGKARSWQARKKDIDFWAMTQESHNKAQANWQAYQLALEKIQHKPAKKNLDKKLLKLNAAKAYGIDPKMTKEQYINHHSQILPTFAILNQGQWIESSSSARENSGVTGNLTERWANYFIEVIDQAKDDDLLSILECCPEYS